MVVFEPTAESGSSANPDGCATPTKSAAYLAGIAMERKRAERDIQQKRQFIEAMLESVQVGMAACSPTGEVTLHNNAIKSILGAASLPASVGEWSKHFTLYAYFGMLELLPEGEVRERGPEPAIVTAGNEVADLARLVDDGEEHYRAELAGTEKHFPFLRTRKEN